jgi:hypothetical protein
VAKYREQLNVPVARLRKELETWQANKRQVAGTEDNDQFQPANQRQPLPLLTMRLILLHPLLMPVVTLGLAFTRSHLLFHRAAAGRSSW